VSWTRTHPHRHCMRRAHRTPAQHAAIRHMLPRQHAFACVIVSPRPVSAGVSHHPTPSQQQGRLHPPSRPGPRALASHSPHCSRWPWPPRRACCWRKRRHTRPVAPSKMNKRGADKHGEPTGQHPAATPGTADEGSTAQVWMPVQSVMGWHMRYVCDADGCWDATLHCTCVRVVGDEQAECLVMSSWCVLACMARGNACTR
jgi:hypothetical protein